MKITIYTVADDYGVEVFTTAKDEEAHCQKLIRESGIEKAIQILDSGLEDAEGEAWCEFAEVQDANNWNNYIRGETELELPNTATEAFAFAHLAAVTALKAIVQRVNGEWNAPELISIGPLFPDTEADVKRIAEEALKEIESK